MTCSIIIPTLNEASVIARTLRAVREQAPQGEVIVVDGASSDDTVARARPYAEVIETPRGRGVQLNAGARASSGEVLLFLHADTVPDAGGIAAMLDALANNPNADGGAFRLRFDDPRPVFKTIADQITRRSLRTHTYTGDQAIFIQHASFFKLGCYRPWRFMEDVELSERMARSGKNILLDATVTTSARRHRQWGLPRTQAAVMLIRALYMARVHPDHYAWLWPEVREC